MKRNEELNLKLLSSKVGDIIELDDCDIIVKDFEANLVKGCKICIFDTTYCPRVNGTLCCIDNKLFVKSVKRWVATTLCRVISSLLLSLF